MPEESPSPYSAVPIRGIWAASIALVLATFSGCTASQREPDSPSSTAVLERQYDIEQRIFLDANSQRARVGKPRLTRNPLLNKAAYEQAVFMATTGKFKHQTGAKSVINRVALQGYSGGYPWRAAENIAFLPRGTLGDADTIGTQFVEMWIESDAHRGTLLGPDFVDTGVTAVKSPRDGRFYAVQVFGSPRR